MQYKELKDCRESFCLLINVEIITFQDQAMGNLAYEKCPFFFWKLC